MSDNRSGPLPVLLALLFSLSAVPVPGAAPTTTTVTVDGAGSGRTFDGIGAVSGGGGNSRLLLDYPEPQRGRILDYLFEPGYGAALQLLKVEIGGDMNSTDGAEPSHMHTAGDLDCDRGYEWWLMEEAKRRNPAIKLAALSWGAPGWIGRGRFWSDDMIGYLMKWLGCAERHHLRVDYIGGWNENGFDASWYKKLHAALRAGGHATKVVAADSGWDVAGALAADPAFAAAVDVVGAHYPCEGGDGGNAHTCHTPEAARTAGKPIWASENGSQDHDAGAAAMARAVNLGYVDGRMTSFINWPLVAATPPGLPFPTTALIVDDQPWSGRFAVGKQVWVTAQTTQFTRPGWTYLDGASGLLGGDRVNGSYVTLKSPDGRDYSTVIETTRARADQTATFTVTGGLSTGTVHLWSTDLASTDPAGDLAHVADVTPHGGSFSVTLKPGRVYTLTTTTGQGRGDAVSGPPASFGLPYSDDFDGSRPGSIPAYLAPQHGAFEVTPCGAGRAGRCVRQMSPVKPIVWHDNDATPYSLIGDAIWANYTIGADVMLEGAGSAELLGRYGGRDYWEVGHIDAYYLRVTGTGEWSIVRGDTTGGLTTLASGRVAALGTRSWHRLALTFQDDAITAAIDGRTAGTARDTAYTAGPAGLAVGVGDGGTRTPGAGWLNARFDDLTVTPGRDATTGTAYTLVNAGSGKVLTVSGDGLVQATGTGAAGQRWKLEGHGTGYLELVTGGRALTASSRAAGAPLHARPDTRAERQQWRFTPTGDGAYTITNRDSGDVAGVRGGSLDDDAPVVQAPASGAPGERWTLVPAPTAGRRTGSWTAAGQQASAWAVPVSRVASPARVASADRSSGWCSAASSAWTRPAYSSVSRSTSRSSQPRTGAMSAATSGAAARPRSRSSIAILVRRARTSSRRRAPSCEAAYTTSARR